MPLQVNVQDWHWIISAWLLIADKKLFRYIEMLLLLCLLHFQIQGTVRSKKVDALSFYNFAPFQIPSPDLFEHRIFFFSFDKYVLHLVFQTIQLRYLDIFKSRLRCLHSTQAKLIHSRNRLGRCFCKPFEWRTDWATVVAVCFVCDVWHNPSPRTYDLYWNTDLIDVLIRLRLFDKLQRRRRHLS